MSLVATSDVAAIDTFLDLVHARRSIRGFDESREVTDEQVRMVLEAARWAPSGGNGQPWQFVVIRDKTDRHWNAELYMKQLEPKKEMEMAVRGQIRITGDGFKHAPVHILVLGDPRVNESYPVRTKLEKSARHFHSGLANATLLMMLAATAQGLASQYVSDACSPYMGTLLKVRYGIPDPLEIYELMPIGWPSVEVKPTPRRPLDEIVHLDRFDVTKFHDDADVKEYLWRDSRLGAYGKGPSRGALKAGSPNK